MSEPPERESRPDGALAASGRDPEVDTEVTSSATTSESGPIERDPVEPDPVERDPVEPDPVERDSNEARSGGAAERVAESQATDRAGSVDLADVGESTEPQAPDSDVRIGAAPPPAELATATGLHTNTRLTLLFVAFITLVVVASWGSAKVACNYHPPQSRGFKPAPLDKLATRPKNSALEFHHSLFVQDYERARELASDTGAQLIEAARTACDAACQAERPQRVEQANTRATLFKIRGPEAWVKAETFYAGQIHEQTYRLERDKRRWLVVETTEPPDLGPGN